MTAEEMLDLIDEAVDDVASEDQDGEDAVLTLRSVKSITAAARAALKPGTGTNANVAMAARAYEEVYSDPVWGLKASEEDALLAVINALYPDFPTGADGIYALRDDPALSELATQLFERAGDFDSTVALVEWLVAPLYEAMAARPAL